MVLELIVRILKTTVSFLRQYAILIPDVTYEGGHVYFRQKELPPSQYCSLSYHTASLSHRYHAYNKLQTS